jgi:hypothetical protein
VSREVRLWRRRSVLQSFTPRFWTVSPAPLPPLTTLERRSLDYSGLDAAMAFADAAMRNARRMLGQIAQADQRPSPVIELAESAIID